MSKSLLGGGAVTAVALLSVSLIFQAEPSIAEPLASAHQGQQQPQQKTAAPTGEAAKESVRDEELTPAATANASNKAAADAGDASAASLALQFTATAYSLRGRTASGRNVARGIIAADRRVLPLGTLVRLEAGSYSGEYLVADTGGLVRGRKIDIWMPSSSEAMRFGRRPVKLPVLSYGGRRANRPPSRVRR